MAEAGPGQITLLLNEMRQGNQEAQAKLVPLIYEELRRMARKHLRGERANHTLQATELVNEAFLRLTATDMNCSDRGHFFALAATQMRRILVDYARRRNAQKRGEGTVVTLDENLAAVGFAQDWDQILAVHEGLSKLAELDARKARVVELRFFTGLEIEEIAGVMQLSSRTIKRDLQFAQAWLYAEIFPDAEKSSGGCPFRPATRA
jgi:RNA polymerase sigma factor (TIGR02999 family)